MPQGKVHSYPVTVKWTGNLGHGTRSYTEYERAHVIESAGKPAIPASSDPAFRGDRLRYNPEELLVAALSACHMLWYLHLCSISAIVVVSYVDHASGTMVETADGGGHFTEVVLAPEILVKKGADMELARKLHDRAHHLCFIASSVIFPVRCQPVISVEPAINGTPR